jgi:hypothetical protein
MGYLRRQLVTSALVANAIRPAPGYYMSVASMFAGWLVSELAPHVAVGAALDTSREMLREGGNRSHAMLGLANLAGLAAIMRHGGTSRQTFESGLADGLGAD